MTGHGEHDGLHDSQVEQQARNIGGVELGVAASVRIRVDAPKGPEAVPCEAVGDGETERHDLG